MYSKDYQVRFSECGASRKVKMVSIFNYLQDVADEHALQLGLSTSQLNSCGYAWVLYRYRLKICRYPSCGETVRINTWPWMDRNLYEMRFLDARDEEGKPLFEANTCWLMIDVEKGSPLRLNRTAFANSLSGEREIINDLKEIPVLEKTESELVFKVRLHDLDINQHVNNAIYPEWAMETIPLWGEKMNVMSKYQDYRPMEIEINYRSPALYGDMVHCQTARDGSFPDPVFLHRISRESDGKELARLRTRWKKFG